MKRKLFENINSHRKTINRYRETRSDFPWEVVTSFLLIFYLERIVELTYMRDNNAMKRGDLYEMA